MTDLLYDDPVFTYDGAGQPTDPNDIYDGAGVQAIFTPPTVLIDPPYLPETTGPALSLFRHYTPRAVGVNVFQLSNGGDSAYETGDDYDSDTAYGGQVLSYVQDYATPENQDTSIPYPWDPYNPGAPFARIYDFHGNETDVSQNPFIIRVFYGGHSTPVDVATAESLAAAGYAECLVYQ